MCPDPDFDFHQNEHDSVMQEETISPISNDVNIDIHVSNENTGELPSSLLVPDDFIHHSEVEISSEITHKM